MDPVSAITMAIAAGAAAALKDATADVVRDGYAALRALMKRKFGSVDVEVVERKPESRARQMVLGEELSEAGADDDEEVLAAAQALLKRIEENAPEAAGAIGVDIENIKAANVTIEEVRATGTGVKARGVEASGDVSIRGVTAGTDPTPKKKS